MIEWLKNNDWIWQLLTAIISGVIGGFVGGKISVKTERTIVQQRAVFKGNNASSKMSGGNQS